MPVTSFIWGSWGFRALWFEGLDFKYDMPKIEKYNARAAPSLVKVAASGLRPLPGSVPVQTSSRFYLPRIRFLLRSRRLCALSVSPHQAGHVSGQLGLVYLAAGAFKCF